jgi:hypothetical protein
MANGVSAAFSAKHRFYIFVYFIMITCTNEVQKTKYTTTNARKANYNKGSVIMATSKWENSGDGNSKLIDLTSIS